MSSYLHAMEIPFNCICDFIVSCVVVFLLVRTNYWSTVLWHTFISFVRQTKLYSLNTYNMPYEETHIDTYSEGEISKYTHTRIGQS